MIILVVLLAWLLVGSSIGLYEARRGHWRWFWLLGTLAGPFALPLGRQLEQNERLARPIDMGAGSGRGPGTVRLLVGVDGSEESVTAARAAADLLGSRLGDITLAMVMDFDVHETVPGPIGPDHPRVARERAALDHAVKVLSGWLSFEPATILLSGSPAIALGGHASSEGFDLIAVGSRGGGLSKRMLGSCASQLAQRTRVPALIIPSADRRSDDAPSIAHTLAESE